jgi:hypothetical protein
MMAGLALGLGLRAGAKPAGCEGMMMNMVMLVMVPTTMMMVMLCLHSGTLSTIICLLCATR